MVTTSEEEASRASSSFTCVQYHEDAEYQVIAFGRLYIRGKVGVAIPATQEVDSTERIGGYEYRGAPRNLVEAI